MSDFSKLCAVYLRISLDRDMDGLAIDRQRGECMRIVNERGWIVWREYVDQSKSATNKAKHRPAYDQMVADYKAGRFTNIVCYDLDRLTRQPRQLEDWIDAAQDGKLVLVTANGEADLSTDGGRMYARVKAAVAAAEVERKGARQNLAHKQRAKQGRPPAGVRPLGYRNDGSIVEDEAKVVRAIYHAFDAGSAVRQIARALSGEVGENIPADVPKWQPHTITLMHERNERRRAKGVPEKPVPEERAWSPSTVLGILRNPRYAAYSTYTDTYALKRENRRRSWRAHIVRDNDGEPISGNWEPIIDRDTWERVQARLDAPERVTNHEGTSRKHLGSGLYVCGICGRTIRSHTRGYRCPGHFTRSRKNIDNYVLDVVRLRLQQSDVAELVPSENDPEKQRLDKEIADQRARVRRAEADYDEELIEARDLKRIRDKATAEIETLMERRSKLMPSSALSDVIGADNPADAFNNLDVGRKQEVIRTLMTVKLLPHPKGVKKFDGSDVIIEWK